MTLNKNKLKSFISENKITDYVSKYGKVITEKQQKIIDKINDKLDGCDCLDEDIYILFYGFVLDKNRDEDEVMKALDCLIGLSNNNKVK